MGRIVVAGRPFRLPVIDILPVWRSRCGLCSPRAIVSAVVGHALGIGVRYLILQSLAHLLLQRGLQCVIAHGPVRLRPRSEFGYGAQKCRVVREKGAWS